MATSGVRLRLAVLATALALCACAAAAGGAAAPTGAAVGTRSGQLAPPLSGTSLRGHRLSLAAWRGSVVVLVFWASWCVPCQAEQPALNSLAEQGMPLGVRFAGVSVDVDRGAAERYTVRYAVPYDSLVDTSQSLAVDFAVAGPPTTYVIGRSGRIAAELVGELDMAHLRTVITAAGA